MKRILGSTNPSRCEKKGPHGPHYCRGYRGAEGYQTVGWGYLRYLCPGNDGQGRIAVQGNADIPSAIEVPDGYEMGEAD